MGHRRRFLLACRQTCWRAGPTSPNPSVTWRPPPKRLGSQKRLIFRRSHSQVSLVSKASVRQVSLPGPTALHLWSVGSRTRIQWRPYSRGSRPSGRGLPGIAGAVSEDRSLRVSGSRRSTRLPCVFCKAKLSRRRLRSMTQRRPSKLPPIVTPADWSVIWMWFTRKPPS